MILRRLIPLAILPLALAACDDELRLPWDRAAEPEAPAVTGPPAVSPLEVPVEAPDSAPVAIATAESRTLNETAFVAQGPGSAWRVEVNGNKARYRRAGARDVVLDVRRIVFSRGVEYVGTVGGAPFAVTVLGAGCETAGMERGWTMAARLRTGSRTLEGCAANAAKAPASTMPPAPAAQPAAPARKAPAASPPAAPKPSTPAAAPTPDPAPAPAADPPADEVPKAEVPKAEETDSTPATPAPEADPAPAPQPADPAPEAAAAEAATTTGAAQDEPADAAETPILLPGAADGSAVDQD